MITQTVLREVVWSSDVRFRALTTFCINKQHLLLLLQVVHLYFPYTGISQCFYTLATVASLEEVFVFFKRPFKNRQQTSANTVFIQSHMQTVTNEVQTSLISAKGKLLLLDAVAVNDVNYNSIPSVDVSLSSRDKAILDDADGPLPRWWHRLHILHVLETDLSSKKFQF